MVAESRPARIHPPEARFSYWSAPDGQDLRLMGWRQPAGRPIRGHLLFAGGRADFIEKYIEAYSHWHDAGWNVTAFDWRGQGLSRGDKAPENPDEFETLVDDLAGLIVHWRSTPGPNVAIGHSMGGHLLLRALADRDVRVDAAVLVAPMILAHAPVPDWMAPNLAEFMCMAGLRAQPMWKSPRLLQRPGSQRQRILTGCRPRYEDELYWWREQPSFRLGAPSWGWMRAAYRSAAAGFSRQKLAKVDLPVLLLGTDRDRLVSPSAIRHVASLLPRAELEMYRDAAHEILREEDRLRDAALARIDSFLDQHAS